MFKQAKSGTARTALTMGVAALAIGAMAAAFAADPVLAAGDGGAKQQSKGAHGGGSKGGGQKGAYGGGQMRGKGGKSLSDIFGDVAGVDDDSDRPAWAKQPGGKDGAGGGRPPTSGSKKGDLFGDLWIILRDENGVPILTAEGWAQPLDADGNLIALDEEGHPVDESLTQEVELGRLNVGRAPASVLDRRADEVVALLNAAEALATDPAGRLVITVDGESKTIDSPLENLAIYVALMTEGSIPGVASLPGTEFDFLVDGQYTSADLEAARSFLAAATDKTGVFTSDEVAYINAFLDINTRTEGSTTYSVVDYSDFAYDRASTYGGVTATVLVAQPDGSFAPETINVYDVILGGQPLTVSGTLSAWTEAADDAREVINYIHEFEVPSLDATH